MSILRDLPEGPGPWVALLIPAASWPELDDLAAKAWNGDKKAGNELGGRFIAMMDKNRQYGRLPPEMAFRSEAGGDPGAQERNRGAEVKRQWGNPCQRCGKRHVVLSPGHLSKAGVDCILAIMAERASTPEAAKGETQ